MKTFLNFISEASESSQHNKAYGEAYETATVLHLHNNTAAKHNTDPAYQSSIAEVKKKHAAAMAAIPEHLQKRATEAATNSSKSYLKSLKGNHGKSADDIHEIHHTHGGIDTHIGKKVDRAMNPHDLVIKGKGGFIHGASLKATSGTASNNPVNSFDKNSGLKTNLSSIWKKGIEKAGLGGKSTNEIKAVRDTPEVKEANKKVQAEAANHHADAFNNASHEEKKAHLHFLLKGRPDLKYDYVKGEHGGSATPHSELPHMKAIAKAKSLTATVNNNRVHIHDESGNHIATVEHRPTHGSFVSPQANAKFGNIKELKQ